MPDPTDITPDQKKQIITLLREIVKSLDLDALALATDSGIRVAFFSSKETNPDTFAALSGAMSSLGRMVIDRVDHEQLFDVTIRGKGGYTVMGDAGDFVLVGVSQERSSLGLALRIIRHYCRRIPEVFEKKEEEMSALIDELKTLLG